MESRYRRREPTCRCGNHFDYRQNFDLGLGRNGVADASIVSLSPLLAMPSLDIDTDPLPPLSQRKLPLPPSRCRCLRLPRLARVLMLLSSSTRTSQGERGILSSRSVTPRQSCLATSTQLQPTLYPAKPRVSTPILAYRQWPVRVSPTQMPRGAYFTAQTNISPLLVPATPIIGFIPLPGARSGHPPRLNPVPR